MPEDGMPQDEFDTDLEWPSDPIGERRAAVPAAAEERPEQDSPPPPPNSEDHDGRHGEGHDRASDRLLERIDILRRDVDAHLADLRAELGGIRQSLADLAARPAEPSSVAAAPSLEPLLTELAHVHEELASLRRRISLRADADRAVLSDEELTRIARTVADLLSGGTDRGHR
jgi:hypothetical protein